MISDFDCVILDTVCFLEKFMKKILIIIASIFSVNASIMAKFGMLRPSLARAFAVATPNFYKNYPDPSAMKAVDFFQNITKLSEEEIRDSMYARYKNYDMKISDLNFLIKNLNNEKISFGLMWFLDCAGYVQNYTWKGYFKFIDVIIDNQDSILQKLKSFNSKNTESISELLQDEIDDLDILIRYP